MQRGQPPSICPLSAARLIAQSGRLHRIQRQQSPQMKSACRRHTHFGNQDRADLPTKTALICRVRGSSHAASLAIHRAQRHDCCHCHQPHVTATVTHTPAPSDVLVEMLGTSKNDDTSRLPMSQRLQRLSARSPLRVQDMWLLRRHTTIVARAAPHRTYAHCAGP
jgi:hypothetical protein